MVRRPPPLNLPAALARLATRRPWTGPPAIPHRVLRVGPDGVSGRFTSRLHDERVAAWLGVALGVSFVSAFATGLISHFMQHPPGWAQWPSRPVNLYRVTQGVHVIGGLATVPLLLAKLWTVYPKLWQWPPVRSLTHAARRLAIFALVGGALFQTVTGVLNIGYWYAFPFLFTTAHYWTAYIVFGALLIHAADRWPATRRAVMTRPQDAVGRRGFLLTVAAASGVIAATTVGETFAPLARLAVLAPRRPGHGTPAGPRDLPVNKSAAAAGVTVAARDPGWRLTVTGRVRRELVLSLEELRALPQHSARLPIACVEGWSVDGDWRGVRLRDLLALAGAPDDARVRVESLQAAGIYRTSQVDARHWHDPLTLLALDLGGAPLDLDHGRPCRLIAPNRPGVMQTKWVHRLVIT
ncbi:DMSO/TMAO reductase YedYZ molybdopterin-dependent catalytic subunit [Actinomadura pelletieri DSM 43383]|uniref:DMSO/TMAO reductase YedYZ molybdopterin-dependent catalytic subunit n=1 Tax=Actinomadura pelletieri DSM 43383 TaxID=1120940 RepID=A0A495QM01_9ACTN|nr:molybdopterin-dependent oxidoreductase [Actinomadura pelletieri]RKS73508.1 DMSO/TMAO reductase YedYZ molybdopterin-dependent catalytic subunit [Actinomadura pelletieri DSM 43383]